MEMKKDIEMKNNLTNSFELKIKEVFNFLNQNIYNENGKNKGGFWVFSTNKFNLSLKIWLSKSASKFSKAHFEITFENDDDFNEMKKSFKETKTLISFQERKTLINNFKLINNSQDFREIDFN